MLDDELKKEKGLQPAPENPDKKEISEVGQESKSKEDSGFEVPSSDLEKENIGAKTVELGKEGKGGEGARVSLPAGVVKKSEKEKTKNLKQLEKILASDLEDYFVNMPPQKQIAFKRVGEELAIKVEVIINEPQISSRSLLKIILNWLKMVPGINKFFVEKAAKIKTHKIIMYKEELDRRQGIKTKIT